MSELPKYIVRNWLLDSPSELNPPSSSLSSVKFCVSKLCDVVSVASLGADIRTAGTGGISDPAVDGLE